MPATDIWRGCREAEINMPLLLDDSGTIGSRLWKGCCDVKHDPECYISNLVPPVGNGQMTCENAS
jgi:hypothetical protein